MDLAYGAYWNKDFIMANITFNSIVSSTSTAGNFKASEMWSSHATYTGNFNAVTDQVNRNLDSINYGVSSFQSSNIGKNAILSQHITNNAILSDKIGDGAVVGNHMNFQSTASGVRAVQIGRAGVKLARYEVSVTMSEDPAGVAGYYPFLISFSASRTATFTASNFGMSYTVAPIDGNPAFTATPVVIRAAESHGAAAMAIGHYQRISALDSKSVVIEVWKTGGFSTSNSIATYQVLAIGA